MELRKPKLSEIRQLIGNPDAYAVQHADGTWTPERKPLTDAVLRSHRRGDYTVGTYIVRPPDTARTLVFDIDAKSDDEAIVDAKAITSVLIDINRSGRRLSWTMEWSGRKGWHVWILAEDYLPAEVLYRLGRGIREEAGLPKLEVYPKQTFVDETRVTRSGGTSLGNLVKLPGGTHQMTGKHNDIFGEFGKPVSVEELTELADLYPETSVQGKNGEAVITYPCVSRIQEGVVDNRNIHYFHLATMMRRFSINDANIMAMLERASVESGNPLERDELEAIVENSKHSGPICGQLDTDVHCGEDCMLTKHNGLYTRPGGVKWAQEGEKVVVEVVKRTEGGHIIELGHEDIVQARATLKDPAPRRKNGD